MKGAAKTWWGHKFIEALEGFTDYGRLSRGRAYRTDARVKQWSLEAGAVSAKIRGNINPYFGTYEEPLYTTTVQMTSFSASEWKTLIGTISERSSSICKLMTHEMPDDIEESFAALGLHLLPVDFKDFKVECSCPDYDVPCKHIAGVCYRLGELLDYDPFLLFELRGLARTSLHKELAKTELGSLLLQSLRAEPQEAPVSDHYFCLPQLRALPQRVAVQAFWQGKMSHSLPVAPAEEAAIPALQLKKGGDHPQFWLKNGSFLESMEKLYLQLRKQSRKLS